MLHDVITSLIVVSCSLATGTEYVRSRLAAYGNDLLSLGADGLRLDAAKRESPPVVVSQLKTDWAPDIASGDIANILSRLTRRPYITQEVIFGAGEPITPSEYVNNGKVSVETLV